MVKSQFPTKIIDGINYRHCILCSTYKSLILENFGFRKDRNQYEYECRICANERKAQWKKDNPEKVKSSAKAYYTTEEYREKAADKKRQRRLEEPCFKMFDNISREINRVLQENGNCKSNLSMWKYLNYSKADLVNYIESFFEPWMNWNNYGKYNTATWKDNDITTWKWSLDHIVPRVFFLYDSMDHINFQKCWALSNLRPYSAKQNLLDGASKIRHKTN